MQAVSSNAADPRSDHQRLLCKPFTPNPPGPGQSHMSVRPSPRACQLCTLKSYLCGSHVFYMNHQMPEHQRKDRQAPLKWEWWPLPTNHSTTLLTACWEVLKTRYGTGAEQCILGSQMSAARGKIALEESGSTRQLHSLSSVWPLKRWHAMLGNFPSGSTAAPHGVEESAIGQRSAITDIWGSR
jgi:hypothetical protein